MDQLTDPKCATASGSCRSATSTAPSGKRCATAAGAAACTRSRMPRPARSPSTNVACRLLDTGTARCSDYKNRKAFVPDCLRLTSELVKQVTWLPRPAPIAAGPTTGRCPTWHYLLSGDRDGSAPRRGLGDRAGDQRSRCRADRAPPASNGRIRKTRSDGLAAPQAGRSAHGAGRARSAGGDPPPPDRAAHDPAARARRQRGALHAAALGPHRRRARFRRQPPRLARSARWRKCPRRRRQGWAAPCFIAARSWRCCGGKTAKRRPALAEDGIVLGGPEEELCPGASAAGSKARRRR